MRELDFKNWLDLQGYGGGTIQSRVSNCLRICEYEGDLDTHFTEDKCQCLLNRLTYTTADERQGFLPKHDIPIGGHIRNGTATLKQAANLYLQFCIESNLRLREHPAQSPIKNSTTSQDIPPRPMLDSYALFFDYFGIDKETFYSFGVENTLFAEISVAQKQWQEILEKLCNNKPIAIRGYGRQGKNTVLYSQLYQSLFGNGAIYQDPTNNTAPRKNMQLATGHRINTTLSNYQCSHIFGRTKNPLLFESVWNICFTPKMFDPLTGHETTGIWPAEYQKIFQTMAFSRFHCFIDEYNDFVTSQQIAEKIQRFAETIAGQYDKKLVESFLSDALSEWAFITCAQEATL